MKSRVFDGPVGHDNAYWSQLNFEEQAQVREIDAKAKSDLAQIKAELQAGKIPSLNDAVAKMNLVSKKADTALNRVLA